MNYRHAYHAGNFADVFKHVTLMLLINHLRNKDKPFTVIDTHAGIGIYDLAGEESQKTLEYHQGIMRLMDAKHPSSVLLRFRQLVADIVGSNPNELSHYPGSPRIARSLLRESDRLQLVELHPEDLQSLQSGFAGDRQTVVHHMDAYLALKALLPPTPRRGLVLIDPPYEKGNEFQNIISGLLEGIRRWSTGIYAIWYPLKSRQPVDWFHRSLVTTGARRILDAELIIQPLNGDTLNGCGMTIINAPWRFDTGLWPVLNELAKLFAGAEGKARIRWIVPE